MKTSIDWASVATKDHNDPLRSKREAFVLPEGVIYHRAWRGPKEYLPLRWRYGIGQGAYYGKHLRVEGSYMAGRLARLLRHHLWLSIRRSPREPKAAAGHLIYVGGVLTGLARRLGGRGSRAARSEPAGQLPA